MDNDLISREALKKQFTEGAYTSKGVREIIDNAPTVLFPLTIKITDKVTNEDIETLKRLMRDYKPQVLNLELEKSQEED